MYIYQYVYSFTHTRMYTRDEYAESRGNRAYTDRDMPFISRYARFHWQLRRFNFKNSTIETPFNFDPIHSLTNRHSQPSTITVLSIK